MGCFSPPAVGLSERGDVVFSKSNSLNEVRRNGGGKAANLAVLSAIQSANVPLWGFVSHSIFRKLFLSEDSEISRSIEILSEACKSGDPDTAKVYILAERVREKIEKKILTPQALSALQCLFDEISVDGPIAVRSSAITEDSLGASFAGLYDSILNQRTFDDFLKAIKTVWASVFSDRAIKYYIEKKFDIKNAGMGVVVQKMMMSRSSGTAFTMDVATGYRGINIISNFGVEGIVGGESGDSYLFSKSLVPITRTLAPKTSYHRAHHNASGIEEVAFSEVETRRESISWAEAKRIALILQEIAQRYFSIYQGAIDTEFCIDPSGDIHFLQVRPVTDTSSRKVYDLDPSIPLSSLKTIAEGRYSVSGVSQGRVKVITRFSQLESRERSIEPEDIIVAHRTENSWSQFFTKFRGIVSMEGNPTAHPMLIAREHGVPCVIGVKDAVDVFSPYDGQIVTIDGFRRKVYLGRVPVVEVPLSRISELFEPVTPEILPTMSELVAEAKKKGKMFTDEAGKAWFVKPDSILSGSLLELQLASFAIRDGLLNRAGATPLISIVGEQQVIGGKVYEKLIGSLQEQVNVLDRLTLEQFETYSHQEEEAIRKYLSTCQHFTPTVDQWHAFCNSYREVCAYMWLSFSTRTSKLDHMCRIAHKLQIPKIYFSECEAQIQAGTFEEDVAFKKEMNKLSEKLLGLYTKEELRAISIDSLRASHPDLYNELIYFARQYKFTSSSDWKVEIPDSVVLERLLNTATLLDRGAEESAMTSSDFFVENPELLRWTMLATRSKIQQNNSHHQILRGQWSVREKLLNLGQTIISRTSEAKIDFEALDDKGHKIRKPFLSPTDILDASVEQVEMFIVQFASLS